MQVPTDCAYRAGGRRCAAPTRWELVAPSGEPIIPICNVHRAAAADLLQVLDQGGWMWADRRSAGLWPAHRTCLGLSSIGRRQTCQGAGSPSRAGCPLTGDQRSGSTEWPGRREALGTSPLSEGGPGSGAAPQGLRRKLRRSLAPPDGRSRPTPGPGPVPIPRSPADGPDWLAIA
jgi:hypothetical protein